MNWLGLYLRTTTRRNADGSEVRYCQLTENAWDAARDYAVAKVVFNFGRADRVDGEMLMRLAASMLRVTGDGTAAAQVIAPGSRAPVHVRDVWPYGRVYVLDQLWLQTGSLCPELCVGLARL